MSHRIYSTSVASVYRHYVAKAERRGHAREAVDLVTCGPTGHAPTSLAVGLKKLTTFEDFFAQAPKLNPARALIKGTICGVRLEEIEETTMREIRYWDKRVDEVANGKTMEKILRGEMGWRCAKPLLLPTHFGYPELIA